MNDKAPLIERLKLLEHHLEKWCGKGFEGTRITKFCVGRRIDFTLGGGKSDVSHHIVRIKGGETVQNLMDALSYYENDLIRYWNVLWKTVKELENEFENN